MRCDDACLNIFFLVNPLAKILCSVMEGTYKNPDYEKWLKEKREIEADERFKKMYLRKN